MPRLLWFMNDTKRRVQGSYLVALSTLLYTSVLVNVCDRVPPLKMLLWIYSVCDPFPSTAFPLFFSLSLPLWLACTLAYHAWVKIREQEEDWEKGRDTAWGQDERGRKRESWRKEKVRSRKGGGRGKMLKAVDGVEKVREFTPVSCLCQDWDDLTAEYAQV